MLAVTEKQKVPGTSSIVSSGLTSSSVGEFDTRSIGELAKGALAALGHTDGPGHTEILRNAAGELCLVETAGRAGGFMIADGLVPKVAGFNLARATARQAAGLDPGKVPNIPSRPFSFRWLRSFAEHPRKVTNISGFDNAQEADVTCELSSLWETSSAPTILIGHGLVTSLRWGRADRLLSPSHGRRNCGLASSYPSWLKMKIIDAHLHLSPLVSSDPKACASELDRQLGHAGISRAVVLHLLNQPWTDTVWSAEEFAEAISPFPRLYGFINIHPMSPDASRQLRDGAERLGFIGLKLHPRLQQFDMLDPRVSELIAQAGEMGLPVLIDAFPDGDWLRNGFSPLAFAKVAMACPQTRIIVAHLGGHHCIDFMMLAKRIPNIWFDLSYSLLYYADSPVVGNLLYCCKSLKYERVMYGSDYPDRPVDVTLSMSLKAFKDHGLGDEAISSLLFRNAAKFYEWTDL